MLAKTFSGGAAVLVLAVAATFGAARWSAGEAGGPYAYVPGEEAAGKAGEAVAELAALVPGAEPARYTLQVPERAAPLAAADVLSLPDGQELLVGWQSEVKEPVLRSDFSTEEDLALITALRKYLPSDSTIVAMPSLSARLAHFVEADFPLAGAIAEEGLRLPAPWAGRIDAVAALESRWQDAEAAKAGVFSDFVDALLAEDVYGAARMQVLAGSSSSYVILHVRDIFDIGVAVPERIHVSLRDFPAAGQAHDKSRAVKDWAAAEGYVAYAVAARPGGAVRAYYLADTKDKSTLLGQLLPFDTAALGQVSGTQLVFQTGGYWVYRLQPVTERM